MTYIPTIGSNRLRNDAVTSAKILDGTILNADINASAAIAYSKLTLTNSIVNADVATGAAIAYAKLNISNSIVNADVASGAAIAYSKLALTNSIVNADIATGAAIAFAKLAAPVAAFDFGGQKLTNLGAPTVNTDATTKLYVDTLVTSGIHFHPAVDYATTVANGNLDLTGEETIDGTLTSTSRILVKNQTSAAENGVYTTGAGAWTRVDDMNTAAEINDGSTVWVRLGLTHADQQWTQINTVTTLGTDAVTFAQTSASVTPATLDDLSDVNTSGVIDGSLLRYEATGTVWNDTIALLYSDAGQLQNTTTGSAGGLLLGGDTQWYRSAADVMRTPDALTVDGVSTLTGLVSSPAGFAATSTGTISTDSGNITSSTGNLTLSNGTLNVSAGVATFDGKVVMTSAQRINVGGGGAAKTANYTAVVATDYVIRVDTSGGTFTVSLPSTHTNGDTLVIKDVGGACFTNNLTIDPLDADTIDGQSTYTLDVDYQSVTLVSSAGNWFVL